MGSEHSADPQLTAQLKTAIRAATTQLFANAENYYYLSVSTTEEGHPPVFSAWSREALDAAANSPDAADVPVEWLKWSYSDSPYFNFGESHFEALQAAWLARGSIDDFDDEEWNRELAVRVDTIEQALRELSDEGLFGKGVERDRIVIVAEMVPPDRANTERTIRLNPAEALTQWLSEAAE